MVHNPVIVYAGTKTQAMPTTKSKNVPGAPEGRTPFTARVSKTLYKRLRAYCALNEIKLQDACEAALALMVAEPGEKLDLARDPLTLVTATERHDLLAALDLMRSNQPGSRESREIMIVLLRNWRRVMREAQRQSDRSDRADLKLV